MKTVYQTDDQGYFVAAIQADQSPLEPNVWLIPRGAVEIAPPDASLGQIARMISGAWVLEDLPPPPGPPPAPEVGANQEAVWDGDKWIIQDLPEPEPQPEPEPTPEEIRQAKIRAINVERDRRLNADFLFNGTLFQRDTKSLQRITGAATLAGFAMTTGAQPGDLRWANPDRDFQWIASNNTLVPMDAQTCFAFGQAAANVETSLIFAAQQLRAMDPLPDDYTDDKWWP